MGLWSRFSCSSETKILSFSCESQSGSFISSIPFSMIFSKRKVVRLPNFVTWSKSIMFVRCKSSSCSCLNIFVRSTSASWPSEFSCKPSDKIFGQRSAVCITSFQSEKPQLRRLMRLSCRNEGSSSVIWDDVGRTNRLELKGLAIKVAHFTYFYLPQVQVG